MKQSNLLNAQFARRLFRTAFSSWQLLAVMLIVCMNVAVGSKLYAQSNTIAVKGKVMADGEPVIGATVLVKGVSTGTATDMDGNFSLNVASKAVLVVSSIGYETQEVPVNGRQFINVVLKSDVVTLKDVVVVGYGVQKKVNLTGAVSSVSTDELVGDDAFAWHLVFQPQTCYYLLRNAKSGKYFTFKSGSIKNLGNKKVFI